MMTGSALAKKPRAPGMTAWRVVALRSRIRIVGSPSLALAPLCLGIAVRSTDSLDRHPQSSAAASNWTQPQLSEPSVGYPRNHIYSWLYTAYCASVSNPFGMSCWRKVAEPIVNTGRRGAPAPFGFPDFAKFVQAATNWLDSAISAPFSSRGWLFAGQMTFCHAQLSTR
jgi:hypothetical protein